VFFSLFILKLLSFPTWNKIETTVWEQFQQISFNPFSDSFPRVIGAPSLALGLGSLSFLWLQQPRVRSWHLHCSYFWRFFCDYCIFLYLYFGTMTFLIMSFIFKGSWNGTAFLYSTIIFILFLFLVIIYFGVFVIFLYKKENRLLEHKTFFPSSSFVYQIQPLNYNIFSFSSKGLLVMSSFSSFQVLFYIILIFVLVCYFALVFVFYCFYFQLLSTWPHNTLASGLSPNLQQHSLTSRSIVGFSPLYIFPASSGTLDLSRPFWQLSGHALFHSRLKTL